MKASSESDSAPKQRLSITLVELRRLTPAVAKYSAEAVAHIDGISSTRSAPFKRAQCARVYLSAIAGSPR